MAFASPANSAVGFCEALMTGHISGKLGAGVCRTPSARIGKPARATVFESPLISETTSFRAQAERAVRLQLAMEGTCL